MLLPILLFVVTFIQNSRFTVAFFSKRLYNIIIGFVYIFVYFLSDTERCIIKMQRTGNRFVEILYMKGIAHNGKGNKVKEDSSGDSAG